MPSAAYPNLRILQGVRGKFQPSLMYNEAIHMQFSLLKVASLRFLSALLSSTTYTELLMVPKGGIGDNENGDLRLVLKSIMKSMTQRAVMMNPISESCYLSVVGFSFTPLKAALFVFSDRHFIEAAGEKQQLATVTVNWTYFTTHFHTYPLHFYAL